MNPSTPHPRPELKIYGENIAFVFPCSGAKPADRVHGELWKSAARAVGLAIAALFLFVSLPLVHGQLQMFPAAEYLILGMGGFLLLLAIAAGTRGIYLYRGRHHQIEAALASTLTELSVEDRRLVRRYASGQEEWARSAIHDVIVEIRFEYVQREEETETRAFAVLCLVLQTGQRVDLWEPARAASRQEQDLRWMAGELRASLRVPDSPPPAPMENVKLVQTADGITIEVPFKEPLTEWRAILFGFLTMGGTIGGFLYFATGVVFLAGWREKGLDGIDWKPIKVVSGVGTAFVALAAIGILVQLIGKKRIVRGITDTTLACIGVRAGCLFRRYLSGREESWRADEIAAVSMDCVKDRVQVRLHFKRGVVEHLYGDLHSTAQPRELATLAWISDQLTAALYPRPAGPVQTPSTSAAIINLTDPQRDDDKYRPAP